MAVEDSSEVALVGEAGFEGDFDERSFGRREPPRRDMPPIIQTYPLTSRRVSGLQDPALPTEAKGGSRLGHPPSQAC